MLLLLPGELFLYACNFTCVRDLIGLTLTCKSTKTLTSEFCVKTLPKNLIRDLATRSPLLQPKQWKTIRESGGVICGVALQRCLDDPHTPLDPSLDFLWIHNAGHNYVNAEGKFTGLPDVWVRESHQHDRKTGDLTFFKYDSRGNATEWDVTQRRETGGCALATFPGLLITGCDSLAVSHNKLSEHEMDVLWLPQGEDLKVVLDKGFVYPVHGISFDGKEVRFPSRNDFYERKTFVNRSGLDLDYDDVVFADTHALLLGNLDYKISALDCFTEAAVKVIEGKFDDAALDLIEHAQLSQRQLEIMLTKLKKRRLDAVSGFNARWSKNKKVKTEPAD